MWVGDKFVKKGPYSNYETVGLLECEVVQYCWLLVTQNQPLHCCSPGKWKWTSTDGGLAHSAAPFCILSMSKNYLMASNYVPEPQGN